MRRDNMNDLITITNGIAVLDSDIASRIADFERKLKDIKEAEDKLKQGVLEEMQEKGILKIETEEMTISYIAPTDRETFDSKRFRADHEDLFDEYVRMSPVKASVRIKVKG
jgi:hypothetical protein